MIGKIRAIFRATILIISCAAHIGVIVLLTLLRGQNLTRSLSIRRKFCQRALKIMGTPLDVKGTVYKEGPAIYISNHRSYFDPVVALMDIKALPVAKAEISNWPLIGYGAKASGVMWVKRDSRSSRTAVMEAMEDTLDMGYSVLIYPEGTTTREATTLKFKKGAFSLALDKNIPIVPMAIEYENPDAIWDGPEPFVGHFLKMFSAKKNPIKLRYGAPIFPENFNGDYIALLNKTQTWINKQIVEMQAEW